MTTHNYGFEASRDGNIIYLARRDKNGEYWNVTHAVDEELGDAVHQLIEATRSSVSNESDYITAILDACEVKGLCDHDCDYENECDHYTFADGVLTVTNDNIVFCKHD